jgi:hypothetical protein
MLPFSRLENLRLVAASLAELRLPNHPLACVPMVWMSCKVLCFTGAFADHLELSESAPEGRQHCLFGRKDCLDTEEIVPLAYPARPATHPASLFGYPAHHATHPCCSCCIHSSYLSWLAVFSARLGYLSRFVSYPTS